MSAANWKARVTRTGQVTIPLDTRPRRGLERVCVWRAPSLRELVAAFDPRRHRRRPAERPWDDRPVGGETL
jgi:hypothetical protein